MLPVVDIFAGPGGLGEGFSQAGFDILLSAEMDPIACETLKLRKFYHQFREQSVPEEYYQFIKGEIELEALIEKFSREWDRACSAVLNVELGTPAGNAEFNRKLDQQLEKQEDFILIGGPPCQAYSLAGRSRMLGVGSKTEDNQNISRKSLSAQLAREFYKDKRHTLYLEYLNILCRYQPAFFIMENVKGMGSARSGVGESIGSVFENICFGLRNPFEAMGIKTREGELPKGYKLYSLTNDNIDLLTGYEIQTANECIIRSENYGVPQARHRIIVVGVREDLEILPEKLSPSKTKATVKEAITNMPALRSGLSKEKDTEKTWKNAVIEQVKEALIGHTNVDAEIRKFLDSFSGYSINSGRGGAYIPDGNQDFGCTNKTLAKHINDAKLRGVIQHETRSHIRSDLLRYFLVSVLGKINGKSPRFSEWKGKLGSIRPNHMNVTFNDNELQSSSHNDRFKVQVWDRPASTVVSHISKDGHYFIHPDPTQCRSLTVREVARLQTFPDNYFFCGNRTQQYHQVGNAVPVLLAKQIAVLLKSET
tara:strand:+ start:8 stop:1621 length:1614 start_codon:yes stop_codon:yes gene_type:complete